MRGGVSNGDENDVGRGGFYSARRRWWQCAARSGTACGGDVGGGAGSVPRESKVATWEWWCLTGTKCLCWRGWQRRLPSIEHLAAVAREKGQGGVVLARPALMPRERWLGKVTGAGVEEADDCEAWTNSGMTRARRNRVKANTLGGTFGLQKRKSKKGKRKGRKTF